MDIRLIQINLTNFKGIRDLSIRMDGRSLNVFGKNGTGKTTLKDAFSWLLFDKDSQGKKDFNIKTLDKNGNVLPGLDHYSVDATFEIDGGQFLQLTKTYKEKWTRKKGIAELVFTGHTTDHFIDEAPVSKGEFQLAIKNQLLGSNFDECTFNLLTDVLYFAQQMHWKQRRDILMSLVDEITMESVLAYEPKLKPLEKILGDRSIESYKKLVSDKIKKLNENLAGIPIRVDELNRSKPEIGGINFTQVKKNLETLAVETEALRQKVEHLKKDNGTFDLKLQLQDLKNQEKQLALEEKQLKNDRLHKIHMDIVAIEGDINRSEYQDTMRQNRIKNLSETIAQNDKLMQEFRDKYVKLAREKFVYQADLTCPYCGGEIPEEKHQEKRQTLHEEYNITKSNALAEINKMGKEIKETNQRLQAEVKKLSETESSVKASQERLSALLENKKRLEADVSISPARESLQRQIEDLSGKVTGNGANPDEQVASIQLLIDNNMQSMDQFRKTLAKEEQYVTAEKREEELKAEQKQVATEKAALERDLFLLDEYEMAKSRLLEESVNKRFGMARFKMFNGLVNGSMEPACDIVYDGVPYTDLNNAARINVGLDIINTLSEHYGFKAPVWIDNAESVNDVIPTESQLIQLFVTRDKKLKWEVV